MSCPRSDERPRDRPRELFAAALNRAAAHCSKRDGALPIEDRTVSARFRVIGPRRQRDGSRVMAEKAEKKPEAAAPTGRAVPERRRRARRRRARRAALLTKTPVLLGGVMIIEAVVLFAGFKFLGGGAPKSAAAPSCRRRGPRRRPRWRTRRRPRWQWRRGRRRANKKTVEITVLDFQAPNKRERPDCSCTTCSIFVVTKAEHEQSVQGDDQGARGLD